jgi:glycerophosphoryl diester phosphodiesterase
VICIGRTITEPAVRKKFKAAEPKLPVAVLAQTADDLAPALAEPLGDWIYVRFVPTAAEVAKVHQQGKRVFLVGTTVSGREEANWNKAREAGVDALLTDYPLDCRLTWRNRE